MRKNFLKRTIVLAMTVMMLGSALTAHAENGVYTTKKGDTLSKIAREVYGSKDAWRKIYEANRGQIKDPNKIWSKQDLILPDVESAADTKPIPQTAPETAVDAATALQNVYALLAAQDYVTMRALDGSEAMEAYVSTIAGDRAIYIPDGSLTGKGAGVYKYANGSYYFYYGDYVDGVRSGQGTWFVSGGNYMSVFTGTWRDDAPNGAGTENNFYDGGQFFQLSGSLVNGLWNGTVNMAAIEENGYQYSMSLVADNGIPEDRTEEYFSCLGTHVDMSTHTREEYLPEGQIVASFVDSPAVEKVFSYKLLSGQRIGVTGWED